MVLLITYLVATLTVITSAYETIYAKNYGKSAKNHTDQIGIIHQAQTQCKSPFKTARIYQNIEKVDRPLYQSYCFMNQDDEPIMLPLNGSGHYVLILKLLPSDVKYGIDVTLNSNHSILRDFEVKTAAGDIFNVYDHIALFTVCEDHLWFKNESSVITNGSVPLEFYSAIHGVPLSALALVKNEKRKPITIPTTATKFVQYDLDQEAKFECNGQDLVARQLEGKIHNSFNMQNATFVFNFNFYTMDQTPAEDKQGEDV